MNNNLINHNGNYKLKIHMFSISYRILETKTLNIYSK